MKRGFVFLMVLAVAAMLLAGCAIPGASSSIPGPTAQPPSPGPSTGTIKVLVTDAPGYSVTSVKVWFSEVWLHKADGQGGAGGWIPLTIIDDTDVTFDTDRMIDLAELDGADDAVLLAETQIEEGMEGWYNQIRVIMNEDLGVKVDYTDPDENTYTDVAAKLPSGKLRFVRLFEVVADGDTEILLDFDLEKSVVFTGASQSDKVKVIIKPVVKLSIQQGGKPDELPDLRGDWLLQITLGETTYNHDMSITIQDPPGSSFSGTGGYPDSGPPYDAGKDWTLVGTVSDDDVSMTITYSNGYEAYLMGTVADGNTMSGNWEDNQDPTQSGTWTATLV